MEGQRFREWLKDHETFRNIERDELWSVSCTRFPTGAG